MKNLWLRLVYTGIDAGMNQKLLKKVKISNQVFTLLSAVASLYIFIFYFAGFEQEGLEVILVVCGFAMSLVFNFLHRYLLARLWFIVVINLVVLVFSYLFGRNVGIQWVLFTCGCIPWIFFELRQWYYILFGCLLSACCYYLFYSTGGAPLVAITPSAERFLHISIITAIFLMNGLCVQFFAAQNVRSEQFLLDVYKQFFEDIPSPMWIFDEANLQFLAVNETAEKKYGYTKEEFLSMKVPDIRPAGLRGEVASIIKEKGNALSYDAGYVQHSTKNGSVFYVHILSNGTRFDGRKARIGLAIDVNDKVAAERKNVELNQVLLQANLELQRNKEYLETQEEELRQINEELTQQTEELRASEEELKTQSEELRYINKELAEKTDVLEQARIALQAKTADLEAASRYKSEFLANMSHELRTPLNSILILATLLGDNKSENLTAKQVEYARIIHKSGTDLLQLINDILDLSKIEAGKVEFITEEARISDIAHDLEQLFSVLANEKKIDFEISIAGDAPEQITTDKVRLEQVLKNLLSNAFKFTPSGGRVLLRFSKHGGGLAIAVSDTGIGISPEKQQLIFEAFQQADGATNRRYGGTGLGLSISKELVRRLSGELGLESTPGAGSTFSVYLPILFSATGVAKNEVVTVTPVYEEDRVRPQQVVADDRESWKPGEQAVLIIEDDVVFANYVRDYAHSKGYKAIVALSGDEGVYYARKYRPAAIILDMGLPIIDGRSVLAILKSAEETKHIPVHVVSAEDRTDIPADRIESYTRKPLEAGALEHAFAEIDTYIQEHYKNVLVVSPRREWSETMIATLSAGRADIVFEAFAGSEEAGKMLSSRHFDCVIADIGADASRGVEQLRHLKTYAGRDVYFITFMEGDISPADEKALKANSDRIIVKSSYAVNRLMDEIELFLHKIKNPGKISVPEAAQMEQSGLKGKRVLLADDDMRNVFALTAVLEEQGMEVVPAENGKEAIEALYSDGSIDIILMDIMMPEMDGYEATRRIREDVRFRKIPIIALTAKAMAGDREKTIAAGASDYVAKPVDSAKLFSLMRVWLSM